VCRKDSSLAIGVHLASAALFYVLLAGGFWMLTDLLPFGRTKAENTAYWISAAFSALYMLPKLPAKIRQSWKNLMVPGAFEVDTLRRRAGFGSEYERPRGRKTIE